MTCLFRHPCGERRFDAAARVSRSSVQCPPSPQQSDGATKNAAAYAASAPPSDPWWAQPRTAEEAVDLLGLRECCTTIVGSAAVRGVSGGQKKRVTTGEALLQGSRILVRGGCGGGAMQH